MCSSIVCERLNVVVDSVVLGSEIANTLLIEQRNTAHLGTARFLDPALVLSVTHASSVIALDIVELDKVGEFLGCRR